MEAYILKAKVQLPEGAVLKANGVDIGDNYSTMEESIGVYVNDEKIFEFSHPVAHDAENAHSWEYGFPLETTWTKNGQAYDISVKIPSNWLTATEREYPVEITSSLVSESSTTSGSIRALDTTSDDTTCEYMMYNNNSIINTVDYSYQTAVGDKGTNPLRPVYYLNFGSSFPELTGKDIDLARLRLRYKGYEQKSDYRSVKAYSIESSFSCSSGKKSYSSMNKGNNILDTNSVGGTSETNEDFIITDRIQAHANGDKFYGLFLEGSNFSINEKKFFSNTGTTQPEYYTIYTDPPEPT
jgi:hypothetical protein